MMYTRKINDKQEFTDGKTIQLYYDHQDIGLVRGQYVSNPSEQLIYDEDWRPYIPPEPQPMTEPDETAITIAVKRMLASSVEELSDEEALEVAALYPTWISKIDMQVNVGERYWYDGKLYKVIQQHTVQSDWTPDTAVSLFVEVSIEEWPEWVQPTGAQDAYMAGDKVTFEGEHYISLIDNNTWSPAAYPAGWEKQQ